MVNVTATLPRQSSYWLKHETDPALSREDGVLLSGEGKIDTGTVLGIVTKGAASSAAKTGGNTGDGVLTLDGMTPVLADAMPGVYTVRCTEAVADGGAFEVQNPDGVVIGSVAVGAVWEEGVRFLITDGAADFVVGDGFDITVADGSGKYVVCDLARLDGGETPAAILWRYADATDADAKCVVIVGFCEVVMAEMLFHASFDSTAKKLAAMATLAQRQIKNRAAA